MCATYTLRVFVSFYEHKFRPTVLCSSSWLACVKERETERDRGERDRDREEECKRNQERIELEREKEIHTANHFCFRIQLRFDAMIVDVRELQQTLENQSFVVYVSIQTTQHKTKALTTTSVRNFLYSRVSVAHTF